MTAPDVNDPTAEATELASVGKTEGEIETAAGEQVGDRLGDTPVDGVEQTRNGIGELLTQAAVPIALTTTELGTLTADASNPLPTHVAIPIASHSRLRELVEVIEHDLGRLEHWAVVEIRSLFPQHAA